MTCPYPLALVVQLMVFAWLGGLDVGALAVVAWRLGHRVGGGGR